MVSFCFNTPNCSLPFFADKQIQLVFLRPFVYTIYNIYLFLCLNSCRTGPCPFMADQNSTYNCPSKCSQSFPNFLLISILKRQRKFLHYCQPIRVVIEVFLCVTFLTQFLEKQRLSWLLGCPCSFIIRSLKLNTVF